MFLIHDVAITGPAPNMGNLRTDAPKNIEGKGQSSESLLMENIFMKRVLYTNYIFQPDNKFKRRVNLW